ncbi:MAG TPA: ABC transporter ATP-binding protein/permease [Azospirillum sp.]
MATRNTLKDLVGFGRPFLTIAGGYWSGPGTLRVRLLALALAVLTVGQVIVPILINLWSERLFDALEQRSMDRFLIMIGAVFGIIAFNVAVMVAHLRVKRTLQLGWREWLTHKLLAEWLADGRQHQVTHLPGHHDNPDGRVAEDVRIATEYAIDLAHSLGFCVLLLLSFSNILWMLSGTAVVTVAGITVAVPGYLLHIALLYAAAGTTIALVVGQPLVRAADRRQGNEADFRFGLARIRDHALPIALLHGETGERARLMGLFRGVRHAWDRQTGALANVMLFSASYSVLSMAVPILVAAPSYIAGAITLGVLMQTAQAFQQAVAALSWPIDNLPRVAEWKASVERVLGLHDALARLDQEADGGDAGRILVDRTGTGTALSFHDVTLTEADGRPVIERFSADIRPGQRVLITGDARAATRLFRAVAGVWPWGAGRIALPARTRMFFMPERPYLPHGPLRAALSYPGAPETVDGDAACRALDRVGLHQLCARLDDDERWDEALGLAEQQRLGFARLLIRRPEWIFVEDAGNALDPAGEEDMMRLLDEEFPAATLLTIGSNAKQAEHHTHRLVLDRACGPARLQGLETTASASRAAQERGPK